MNSVDWEEKYQRGDTPWDKGEPSPGLVDFLRDQSALRRGTVVVPGCGMGHDVREWAARGFRVTGLDLAPSAVARAREITPAKLPASFRVINFLTDSPASPVDYLFEHTCFCAIQRDQRDAYVAAVLNWLKPGGNFIAIHYFLPPDDPEGPPFGVDRSEILARFGEGFELVAEWIPRSWQNRRGLERLYWWKKR